MEIIRHRINTLAALRETDPGHGAEFDIRSRGSRLVLNHEPFSDGESLVDFLECYKESGRKGTLIFNTKEDGLEREILLMVRRFEVKDFFFLDLPVPTAVRLSAREGVRDMAVRVSEFEPPEAALLFKGLAAWAWVDCFSGEPPAAGVLRALKPAFKVCLVSPELVGRPKEKIGDFLHLSPLADAACTKFPGLWGADACFR